MELFHSSVCHPFYLERIDVGPCLPGRGTQHLVEWKWLWLQARAAGAPCAGTTGTGSTGTTECLASTRSCTCRLSCNHRGKFQTLLMLPCHVSDQSQRSGLTHWSRGHIPTSTGTSPIPPDATELRPGRQQVVLVTHYLLSGPLTSRDLAKPVVKDLFIAPNYILPLGIMSP